MITLIKVNCEWCQTEFERSATRKSKRFCSTGCQVAFNQLKLALKTENLYEENQNRRI